MSKLSVMKTWVLIIHTYKKVRVVLVTHSQIETVDTVVSLTCSLYLTCTDEVLNLKWS